MNTFNSSSFDGQIMVLYVKCVNSRLGSSWKDILGRNKTSWGYVCSYHLFTMNAYGHIKGNALFYSNSKFDFIS
jgi:hypothetical protein